MPYSLFTPREREVFDLFGEGRNIKKIAERLSLSHRTAEQHRNNLKSKLGIKRSHDLVVMAVEQRFKAKGDDIELAVLKYLEASDDDNATKAAHIRKIVEDHYS